MSLQLFGYSMRCAFYYCFHNILRMLLPQRQMPCASHVLLAKHVGQALDLLVSVS